LKSFQQKEPFVPVRVLYSFPHKLGADRICYTAWQQVLSLAAAGAEVVAMPGVLHRAVPESVVVRPTLSRGKYRVPYKLLGVTNASRLHDHIVARRLEKMVGKIDIVHCWPRGALETLKTAKKLGIPTVLERPNAHTRYCYEAVAKECHRIGMRFPHREYRHDERALRLEESEFAAADRLLCPAAFPEQSFLNLGFPAEKLARHAYGFDDTKYFPDAARRNSQTKFTALFVGVDPVRKGLHLALQAWLSSPAAHNGVFMIAGQLSPEFELRFAPELSHPSVSILGHRKDVPELMRQADVLLLPSLEEGSALVCSEAIGSGCVPLASNACSDACRHMENALVHQVGAVLTLQEHIAILFQNRELLGRLRDGALRSRHELTWTVAGKRLFAVYRAVVAWKSSALSPAEVAGLG
jgi:glycosyltransferase involved in cell wall biosynthesis